MDYLAGKGLVEWITSAYIGITVPGVDEVERALEQPDHATENFAPFNLIHVNQMIHSQIQQGTAGSTQQQTALDEAAISTIVTLVAQLRDVLIPKLEGSDRQEAQAQIETIESQLKSPRPRRLVVIESLRTLRNLAENMLAGATLQAILHHFEALGV